MNNSDSSNEVSNGHWFSISSAEETRGVERRIESLEKKVDTLHQTVAELQSDNLKLVNRILEAEIAVERYRNLLLRKNISFPFSPMLTSKAVIGHDGLPVFKY